MRNVCFLLIILIFSSCKNEEPSQAKEVSANSRENFNWLVGKWQRTNEQEGRKTFENWTKVDDQGYMGSGYTMQEQDTIWQENISLLKTEGRWNFEVTGKGDTQPTVFTITHTEENKFVSENPDNEFPKVISYSGNGKKLSAIISAGDTEVLFEFERIQ